MSSTVTRDGDYIVIRMSTKEAHGLRVALEECPSHSCREIKSKATSNIRARLRRALARASK